MDSKPSLKATKSTFSNNQPKEYVAQMEHYAQIGNASACEIYGDMLMEGVWEIYKMKSDIITGNLLEPTENPSDDPYLLLPRDPIAAIEYYRKAAVTRETALAKLQYCMQKGYAGVTKEPMAMVSSVTITSEMKEFLDKNARPLMPLDLEASGIFDAIPDFRPKIRDPRTFVFKDLAVKWGTRSLYQFVIVEIIAFFLCFIIQKGDFFKAFQIILLGFFTLGVPLIGHAMICLFYADPKGLPLCSCEHSRLAYLNNTLDFSEQIAKISQDPFISTPFYIRNLHKIKQFWFWALFITSIVLLATQETQFGRKVFAFLFYGDSAMTILFVVTTMMIPFFIVIFWEKTFTSLPKYLCFDPFFIQVYIAIAWFALMIAPWTLVDCDCDSEYEKSLKMQDNEKYTMNL